MCATNAALQNNGGDVWEWIAGLYGRDAVMAIWREPIRERVRARGGRAPAGQAEAWPLPGVITVFTPRPAVA